LTDNSLVRFLSDFLLPMKLS